MATVGVAKFLGGEESLVKNPSEGVGPYRSLRGAAVRSSGLRQPELLNLDLCEFRSREDATVGAQEKTDENYQQTEGVRVGLHAGLHQAAGGGPDGGPSLQSLSNPPLGVPAKSRAVRIRA